MPARTALLTAFGFVATFALLSGSQADCGQFDEKARADSETTIDVKAGTTRIDMKVGGMQFTFAKIEVSPPVDLVVKIRLKVAGSNTTEHDHDAEVKATLIGPGDEVLATMTKKREIEEDESNKELTFDFRVTPEKMSAGLRFKLLLSYLP